jgi:HK97 family phage prohead protease
MNRAFSLLETKAIDNERRIVTGLATTPETDRMGDVIDPMGAKFAAELPFLHQHRHDSPVGRVKFGKPTKRGIPFEASLPFIDEPGPLKDRVDTAWLEIKHGLVRGVSIGFNPLKYAYMDNGGVDFQEIEIFELSAVTVPANAGATIQTIKSLAGIRSGGVKLQPAPKIVDNLAGAVRLNRS